MYTGNQNAKDWLVTASGTPIIGFAKGSNIELELAEDYHDSDVGIQGDWTFVEKNDQSATLKFTLQRGSTSNAVLFALLKARTVFAVTLTNIRNGSTHSMPYSMVQKQPKDGVSNGSDAQSIEWTLITGEVESVIL